MYTYIYIYTNTYRHVCARTYIYIYTHIYVYLFTYLFISASTYVNTSILHIYLYTYTNIHVRTHAYIHTEVCTLIAHTYINSCIVHRCMKLCYLPVCSIQNQSGSSRQSKLLQLHGRSPKLARAEGRRSWSKTTGWIVEGFFVGS